MPITPVIGAGGVPTGGTTGQVLKKVSSADYDTSWQNEAGGGVWGSITGTLSNQTDLQNTLNVKLGKDVPIYDAGTKTTAFNFDVANGLVQKVILGASLQFGIVDPSDTTKAHFFVIHVYQDATGSRVWNGINTTNVDLGGIATTGLLTATANNFDTFEFEWFSGKWRLRNAYFARN